MNAALALGDFGRWRRVTKFDQRARRIADRHYSRQSVGAEQFMPNGKTLVMLTEDERALWGVCENLPPNPPGAPPRWRCTIFRNEGAGLSSSLIREATEKTLDYWGRKYGGAPVGVPLTTEVDPSKTRHKRDPGRCFRKAGWFTCAAYPPRNGLVVLVAPLRADAAQPLRGGAVLNFATQEHQRVLEPNGRGAAARTVTPSASHFSTGAAR